MAESFAERRRRDLGITTGTAQPQQPQTKSTSNSFVEKRKRELGLSSTPEVAPVEPTTNTDTSALLNAMKTGKAPSLDVRESPLVQDAASIPEKPNFLERMVQNTVGLFKAAPPSKVAQEAIDIVGRPSEVIAEFATPTAPSIRRSESGYVENVPGSSARQDFLQRTGQEPAQGAEKALGAVAASFLPMGGSGPLGPNAGNLYRAAGNVADRFLTRAGTGVGGKVAREATTEALSGVPLGFGQSLGTGSGDLREAATEGAIGGALGVGIGAGGPALGAAAKQVANSAIERYLGPILKNVTEKGKTPQEEVVEGLFQSASIPNRLTPASNEVTLNRVMEQIKPIVEQRLTPPLENPNELAKYVQQGLKRQGADISLNEVRKVPYEGLQEMAEELRSTTTVYDEAVKAAKERGFNLPNLLEGKTPSIKQRVAEDATNRAYGVYPESLPEVRKPLTNAADEPAKQDWFSRLFGEQNVGITPFGSKKSNRIVTTEQQIVKNPLKNNVDGIVEKTKQAGRATYQNVVDFLSPLKTINRETYDTAQDAARSNNLANTIVRDKFVDNQGNVIGSSLNDVMKEVRGLGKKFDDYLVLRHGITRMKRGERVYDEALKMTPEKAAEAVAKLEARYPGLQKAGQMWDEFNTNLLDSGVREGLITKEARDAMREANPNYAAMRRQFDLSEKLARPKWGSGGSAFSGQRAPINEVSPTGSTRKIVSPVRSAIEQAYAWKNAELRNRTMQEIVKAIQKDPEGMRGIVEIVKKPSTSYRSLDDALREGGSEEFLEQLNNDFKSLFQTAKTGDENIVRAMVNGRPVYVKVHNPEAVKALLGMGSDQAGIVFGALQMLSNATKRGATGLLAPMFAVKNLTADTIQAAIQSPNAIKHIAVDLPHAMISSFADVLRIPGLKNLAEEFRRAGGEYSALLRGDRPVNRAVFNLRKEAPLSPAGIAKGALSTLKAPFKGLEKVADITENANRMAAFRRAMAGKERTPENVRKAINAARESTTNFSRKGSFYQQTEALVPYSNAAVQGLYRVLKSFYKNPVKTLAGVGTLVIGPKLYEYAQFNDDPDYQKLPARERYRNVFVGKNADATFIKMPMPPEYEAFGSFMTDVLNDVVKGDPQAYKGTLDAIVNAFTPPLVSGALQGATQGGGPEQSILGTINSTVAAPFVAITGNKSFTGAPIVPKRLEDVSAKNQFDERTSEISKWVGKKIGMSPLKVDYLLRAYGGDPARLLLPLNSPVGGGTARNTLLKNFISDPVFTNTLSDDFYTAKEKYTKAKNDNKDNGDPLPSWYNEQMERVINSQANSSVTKRLSTLNEQKRQITGNRELKSKDKSQQLRSIQAEINDIYADVNSKLVESGFKFPNR